MNQPAEFIDSAAVNAGGPFTGRRRTAHSDDIDTRGRRRPKLGRPQLAGRHEADPPERALSARTATIPQSIKAERSPACLS